MKNLINVALRHLSSRNCSERELRQSLEKEFANHANIDEHIELTLNRLRELHVLNDARVAGSLAERYSHKGNRFITQVLRQKGVNQDVIESTLTALEPESDRALEVARKKLRGLCAEKPQTIENTLWHFLSSRGFASDTLHQVIEQLKEDDLLVR